jgi:hypothetical protein
MKKFLSVALLLASAWPGLAQSPANPGSTPTAAQKVGTELIEDVEVLRRLLNKSLWMENAIPESPTIKASNPYNSWTPGLKLDIGEVFDVSRGGVVQRSTTSPVQPTFSFDGVYLAGHGIVYTLKVPRSTMKARAIFDHKPHSNAACSACHTTVEVKTSPESVMTRVPTEWEAARDELRGVNRTARSVEEIVMQCEPSSLTDRMTNVLFQNMKNLRNLPANQNVTIVVTYDGQSGAAELRSAAISNLAANTRNQPGSGGKGRIGFGFSESEMEQLNLGDLHLKQGNPLRAILAYEEAAKEYDSYLKSSFNSNPPTGEALKAAEAVAGKNMREVHIKLAQAQLAAGQVENSTKSLEYAKRISDEIRNQKPAQAQAETAIPVPAKLILRVSKVDFENFSRNLADFRKVVNIETIGFPKVPEKQPAKVERKETK